ncbi:hypothetical protein H9655_15080 [Cytobacillus sp. Sa5YUA1]|uniref:DGQHR domain-containing protein n=1 Tax=Cytobacillus stercorigallinarum TaxID=2762240 RepID=A0ABR8QS33_9BACI|nr:DNA sulfur modification protein DndB [Cytobacillus stercorigallinarum]MBD7938356.1 hypothetical protein [Cytobacillus stercorigallinarum]
MHSNDVLAKVKGKDFIQFGKRVLMIQIPFKTMNTFITVDENVQRKMDMSKRREIKDFIIHVLKNNEPFYFSPFIFSARKAVIESEDGWMLVPKEKMAIIDGQHRNGAILSAFTQLRMEKESAEEYGNVEVVKPIDTYIHHLEHLPITMQIYLDLDTKSERQLFKDYNVERREANIGKRVMFDQRDAYAMLARKVACELEEEYEIDIKSSRITKYSSALTTLVVIRKCLIALFEGRLANKKGNPSDYCKEDEVLAVAKAFFLSWKKIFPKGMENRNKYICGLPGVQVALAYCVNRLKLKNDVDYFTAIQLLDKLQCNWKHQDAIVSHVYDHSIQKLKNVSSARNMKRTAHNLINLIEEEM